MMIIILIMMIIIIDEWWTVTPIYVFLISLNSPVDHIYNNAVHIYDNGLPISSNVPRFSQLFPHIYKLCIFSFPRKRPAPVTARTPYSRPKGVLTPELALYFFIGIAKEYILGVHSSSISAVKTKNGGGTFLSLWSWTAFSPQEIKTNYSFADLALHELARDTQV